MILKSLVIISFAALTGCSAFESMMKADKAVNDAKERPTAALANASGDDTPGTCCINGAFHSCPNAGAVAQCAGEPFQLSDCLMSSGCDEACTNQCLEKYGPDPSSCQRDPSKDSTCPQK
jgi:hypothetical protein